MGIGLSCQMWGINRLPGWDKGSYGYHGDDGNAFCGSGQGQIYGPTFTTGDVIGCGLNLIEGSCFYTKNGHNLGTAFTGKALDIFKGTSITNLTLRFQRRYFQDWIEFQK